MANNTTTGTKAICPLIPSLSHSRNTNAFIGISVLTSIDFIVSVFTIVANAMILWTIARTRSLQTPSNTLLAALCSSDLLVGLVTHPSFITTLIYLQLLQPPTRALLALLRWSATIVNGMSFLTVLHITLDRYVAVCFPFFYGQKVTGKKYTTIVALTWVYNAVAPVATGRAYYTYYGAVTIIAFGVMLYCYIRIYFVIARKKRAILPLGTIGGEQREIISCNREERRKSYTIIILLAIFTLSYLPPLAVTFVIYKMNNNAHFCNMTPSTAVMLLWASFCFNLPSMFNPIVYCIFMTPIKEAALRIFLNRDRVVTLERTLNT